MGSSRHVQPDKLLIDPKSQDTGTSLHKPLHTLQSSLNGFLHEPNTNVHTLQYAIEQLPDRDAADQHEHPAMSFEQIETKLALLLGPTTAFFASSGSIAWFMAHSEKTDRSATTAIVTCEATRGPPATPASPAFGPDVVRRRSSPHNEAREVREAVAFHGEMAEHTETHVRREKGSREVWEQVVQYEASSTPSRLDPRHRRSRATHGAARRSRLWPRMARTVVTQGESGANV